MKDKSRPSHVTFIMYLRARGGRRGWRGEVKGHREWQEWMKMRRKVERWWILEIFSRVDVLETTRMYWKPNPLFLIIMVNRSIIKLREEGDITHTPHTHSHE